MIRIAYLWLMEWLTAILHPLLEQGARVWGHIAFWKRRHIVIEEWEWNEKDETWRKWKPR